MTTSDNCYVIGLGEILWDMLPEGKQLGGAPANFAYHAARLGLRSCVVSAIGNDEAGNEIAALLREKELESHLARVDYPTGSVEIALDAAGIPHYDIRTGVAWDNIPFDSTLEQLARQSRAVCFGSLAQRSERSRHTIRQFLQALSPSEGPTYRIFDINLRQNFYSADLIADSLRLCNVLKINDEELDVVRGLFALPGTGYEALCSRLAERFDIEIVILTCGATGSHVFTQSQHSFVETPRVSVADTVGAGDSFTAAFTAGLLGGHSLRTTHEAAVALSAFVCTQHGAMPPYTDAMRTLFAPEKRA